VTRLPQSNGTAGEDMALHWAKQHGWRLFRHQPPTKVVYIEKRAVTIQCKSGGISDFTGYRPRLINMYVAVEAKEATGKTMMCSRLDKDQRDWMSRLPPGCAYVAIAWMDGGNPWCEVHPFKYKGSYKRNEGTK